MIGFQFVNSFIERTLEPREGYCLWSSFLAARFRTAASHFVRSNAPDPTGRAVASSRLGWPYKFFTVAELVAGFVSPRFELTAS